VRLFLNLTHNTHHTSRFPKQSRSFFLQPSCHEYAHSTPTTAPRSSSVPSKPSQIALVLPSAAPGSSGRPPHATCILERALPWGMLMRVRQCLTRGNRLHALLLLLCCNSAISAVSGDEQLLKVLRSLQQVRCGGPADVACCPGARSRSLRQAAMSCHAGSKRHSKRARVILLARHNMEQPVSSAAHAASPQWLQVHAHKAAAPERHQPLWQC
jgi:hypothetical protein